MAEISKVYDSEVKETVQYIVVKIGGEQYGINISYIDNIVRMCKITRVPKAPSFFPGVINLRGEVVPLMSLRRRMSLPDDEITNNSRIIILRLETQGLIGVIVDQVKEVLTLSKDDVEKKPQTAVKETKETFIDGVGKNGSELISILDIAAVMGEVEEA